MVFGLSCGNVNGGRGKDADVVRVADVRRRTDGRGLGGPVQPDHRGPPDAALGWPSGAERVCAAARRYAGGPSAAGAAFMIADIEQVLWETWGLMLKSDKHILTTTGAAKPYTLVASCQVVQKLSILGVELSG